MKSTHRSNINKLGQIKITVFTNSLRGIYCLKYLKVKKVQIKNIVISKKNLNPKVVNFLNNHKIKFTIIKNLKSFDNFSKEEIYDHRKSKFLQIGRDQGFNKATNISDSGLSYNQPAVTKLKIHLSKNKYVYYGLGLALFASLIAILA